MADFISAIVFGRFFWSLFFFCCFVSHAGLVVFLYPPEVVHAGASWSVTPMQWHLSEDEVFLPVGSHTLQFADVPGWVSPVSWPLEIDQPEQTTVILATYSKLIPAECIFSLRLSVTGSLSGRRHPLTMTIMEFAAEEYHVDEDMADYIFVPANWSTVSIESAAESSGLLWATKPARPECVWQLTGKLCPEDQLLLDWQQVAFPPQITAFLTGDLLSDTIEMTTQTNCTLAGEGDFCLQLHVFHGDLASTVHELNAGWNAIGIIHQLLPGSERLLREMKPMIWETTAQTLVKCQALAPGQAGWIFSPKKQRLELVGVETPWSWPGNVDTLEGWRFGTVQSPQILEPGQLAWKWINGKFVPEMTQLWPGEACWRWFEEK